MSDEATEATTSEKEADSGGLPEWAVMPPGFKIPAGRTVSFLKFKAEWTDAPEKGDRQCIVWNLTDNDERIAIKRASGGDAMMVAGELSKQMIRAIDGVKVNWMASKGPGCMDTFWSEMGSKCRQMVIRWYTQNHSLSEAEQADFFENCVAGKSVV